MPSDREAMDAAYKVYYRSTPLIGTVHGAFEAGWLAARAPDPPASGDALGDSSPASPAVVEAVAKTMWETGRYGHVRPWDESRNDAGKDEARRIADACLRTALFVWGTEAIPEAVVRRGAAAMYGDHYDALVHDVWFRVGLEEAFREWRATEP